MCGSVGTVSLFFHCAQREKHSQAPKTDVLKFSKHAERAKKTSEPLQFRGFLIWQGVTVPNPLKLFAILLEKYQPTSDWRRICAVQVFWPEVKALAQTEFTSVEHVKILTVSIKNVTTLGLYQKPNRSPAQRVRFGEEEQQRERVLTYKINRSKRYKAYSDVQRAVKIDICIYLIIPPKMCNWYLFVLLRLQIHLSQKCCNSIFFCIP